MTSACCRSSWQNGSAGGGEGRECLGNLADSHGIETSEQAIAIALQREASFRCVGSLIKEVEL